MTEKKYWPTWKTIQIGTGIETIDDFYKAITEAGYHIFDQGKNSIKKPVLTVAQELTEVDLVKVSVEDLGFPNGATLEEIYERAISMGLKLVSLEVGLQLRLQYPDQPRDEWLVIANKQSEDYTEGNFLGFCVRHDFSDTPWLNARYGDTCYVLRPSLKRVFVFCK